MKGFWRAIHSYDYTGHKMWWFALSGVVILIGLGSLFVRGGGNPLQGLNYGLEFRSGTRITVELVKDADVAAVRAVVAKQDVGSAVIQEAETEEGRRAFQIQVEPLSTAQEQGLRDALQDRFGIAQGEAGPAYASETVGPTFGRDVVTASWEAGLLALIVILIYVSLRFEWKFAIAAIAAEVHDVAVFVGVYSLVGRELTTASIAAVLTIIGYSLYDTVIIFDRIRENAPRMRGVRYGEMVNRSLWETINRSVNTTLTTLLPILCLLFFGGTTLTDFAFALTIGMISGAYSSIFIAAPIATMLKEREPQYRKVVARSKEAKA